MVQPP